MVVRDLCFGLLGAGLGAIVMFLWRRTVYTRLLGAEIALVKEHATAELELAREVTDLRSRQVGVSIFNLGKHDPVIPVGIQLDDY